MKNKVLEGAAAAASEPEIINFGDHAFRVKKRKLDLNKFYNEPIHVMRIGVKKGVGTRIDLDAELCVTDDQVLGALKELKGRSIPIPVFAELKKGYNKLVGLRRKAQALMSYCDPFWFFTESAFGKLGDIVSEMERVAAEEILPELMASYNDAKFDFQEEVFKLGRTAIAARLSQIAAVALKNPETWAERVAGWLVGLGFPYEEEEHHDLKDLLVSQPIGEVARGNMQIPEPLVFKLCEPYLEQFPSRNAIQHYFGVEVFYFGTLDSIVNQKKKDADLADAIAREAASEEELRCIQAKAKFREMSEKSAAEAYKEAVQGLRRDILEMIETAITYAEGQTKNGRVIRADSRRALKDQMDRVEQLMGMLTDFDDFEEIAEVISEAKHMTDNNAGSDDGMTVEKQRIMQIRAWLQPKLTTEGKFNEFKFK